MINFIYFKIFYTADSSYDPNDGKRHCCQHVSPFSEIKCHHNFYYPKKQSSVGKLLVLFKSQLRFKQYIKTKRVCFRIKLDKLTSSNGVTSNGMKWYE